MKLADPAVQYQSVLFCLLFKLNSLNLGLFLGLQAQDSFKKNYHDIPNKSI